MELSFQDISGVPSQTFRSSAWVPRSRDKHLPGRQSWETWPGRQRKDNMSVGLGEDRTQGRALPGSCLGDTVPAGMAWWLLLGGWGAWVLWHLGLHPAE